MERARLSWERDSAWMRACSRFHAAERSLRGDGEDGRGNGGLVSAESLEEMRRAEDSNSSR